MPGRLLYGQGTTPETMEGVSWHGELFSILTIHKAPHWRRWTACRGGRPRWRHRRRWCRATPPRRPGRCPGTGSGRPLCRPRRTAPTDWCLANTREITDHSVSIPEIVGSVLILFPLFYVRIALPLSIASFQPNFDASAENLRRPKSIFQNFQQTEKTDSFCKECQFRDSVFSFGFSMVLCLWPTLISNQKISRWQKYQN